MRSVPTASAEHRVGRCTSVVNRLKATLVRLGIHGFNPKLRNAPERLAGVRTPEGEPIPPNTLAELRRDMAHLRFVEAQIKEVEDAREERLRQAPDDEANTRVLDLKRISYIGIETADMLTHEVFSRTLRDQRAVARYAGLTGSPDESGKRRREKGLARAGNARVRRGMIQLAWCFVGYQKESALVRWYEARVAAGKRKKTMIVALARKLLIGLWRFVTEGVVPEGVALRPAQ